jgi:hypothetical protein
MNDVDIMVTANFLEENIAESFKGKIDLFFRV